MSSDVQDKLVEFVKSRAKHITMLNVTWYGGEPLMAIDIIEGLSKEFMSICNDNNVSYDAAIITNGYYMTLDVAKLLESLNIRNVQVTMDGIEGGFCMDYIVESVLNDGLLTAPEMDFEPFQNCQCVGNFFEPPPPRPCQDVWV